MGLRRFPDNKRGKKRKIVCYPESSSSRSRNDDINLNEIEGNYMRLTKIPSEQKVKKGKLSAARRVLKIKTQTPTMYTE